MDPKKPLQAMDPKKPLQSMDPKKPLQPGFSRLFAVSPIDCKDEGEDKHERCYQMLMAVLADKSAKEANDALMSAVSKDPKTHEDICVGFVVAILVSGGAETATQHFRDLMLVNRDGLQFVCGTLAHLILEKYTKMLWPVKQQLLWFIREMVQAQIAGTDQLCWNMMRQIAGGDVNPTNLWLSETLLEIFIKYRPWVEKFPALTASTVYTYLRLLEDYFNESLEKLRDKVVQFVISMCRERFNDVTMIGRDLVRVLQNVAKIPEIEKLWKDLLHRPKSLSPTFKGIGQLMQTRTSRRFLQSRITPEMEKKIVFLTSMVRFGVHKRYQDWFQQKFLSTVECQSLRCDLIRFIVGVIHPTNELLGSDIIPRWAVIGWLLTTCTTQIAASCAKLALFYDWLFFDPEKDNIMNIEPAILVMHHSMKPHPAITATLLDFLCRIVVHFQPTEQEKVRAGIFNSLKTILDKRVLPSLEPLFDNPRLDIELRSMLRERFAIFIHKEESIDDVMVVNADDLVTGIEEDGPAFSDEEIDEKEQVGYQSEEEEPQAPVQETKKVKKADKPSKSRSQSQSGRGVMSGDGEGEVDDEVKELLQTLRQQEDGESRCEIMEQLVKHITSEDFSYDQCSMVSTNLSEILQKQFEGKIFPENPTPESIEDSICKPLFVAFRALVEMSDSDPHRGHLLQLLAELYALQLRIGYYLLYFMKTDRQVRRDPKAKANIYRDLCEKIDPKYSLDICLVNDMRQCQEDDVDLFVYLIPEVYTNFPKASIGNVDLLYLVVSCVDSKQVCSLVYHVMAKDFIIVKKDCYQDVLQASLNWETFEQMFLWQLLRAHDLTIECVLPLVPTLSATKDHEALSNISLLLKREKPTADLLKHLFAREAAPSDQFVSSIITHWMHEYEEKLGDLISSHLFKQASGGSYKRKRLPQSQNVKSGSGTQLPRPAELVLAHLDRLRQTCKNYEFFNQRSIQSSLQQIRHGCTDSQKKKFMDLFALADSDSEDESMTQQQKNSSKGRTSGTGSSGGGSSLHSKATTKSPAKSKPLKNSSSSTTTFQQTGKLSDSSSGSSGDSEEDKPVSRGRGQSRGGGSKHPGKSRKRAAGRVSYKVSSDDSSDEDDSLALKKKKRKKVSPSDTE